MADHRHTSGGGGGHPSRGGASAGAGAGAGAPAVVGLPLPDGAVELLQRLDECQPTIPDQLTRHCLRVTGNDGTDERLVRLIGLSTQMFLTTVINDALQTCKRRATAQQKRSGAAAAGQSGGQGAPGSGAGGRDRRLVLTLTDVSEALREQGVNARQPPYFVG